MSQLSVRLFGYPQFSIDNSPVKVERRKTLALIVYLAVETGLKQTTSKIKPATHNIGQSSFTTFGREALATLFWPDYPADKAGSYLRQALWDFSKAAGEDWLVKDNQSVGFNPDAPVWIDVNVFRELYTRQIPGMNQQTASTATLMALTELYHEDFLTGFTLPDSPAFDDWQSLHTESLRLQLTLVLEELVDRLSAQRQFEQGIQQALRWLSLDPLNETCHRALMTLYEENDQKNAALQQYEACARQMRKELGIDPSNETVSLYRRIRNQKAARVPPSPQKSPDRPSNHPNSLIGRPRGTVTFLFTDIEGSTQLWEHYPQAMQGAFKRQEEIVRAAMAENGGYVYKMIGDAFQVAFATAPNALRAALAAQRALQAEIWGETGRIKIRMALHTGVTEEREDDYVGPTLNRVARILSAGYGDQILVNQPAFEQLREILPENVNFIDLGERQLKDLVAPEHIYQVTAVGLTNEFPPLKTVEQPVKHLPPQTTPFVGRGTELAEIESRLASPDCRLVTLAGIGGSGKTRLAIQAAGQSETFTGNVYFVGLEAVTDSLGLVAAIADAVNLSAQVRLTGDANRSQTQDLLFDYLARKKALLILDNFEQLIGSADILIDLLIFAPSVKLIVTSRERLNLPGEWVLDVLGLAYPGKGEAENIAQFPSAILFLRTAERTSGFIPKDTDWPAIARICQLLEGVPLGIEMAAGWVRSISCQDVVNEVEKSLDFLSTSWRGLPERHRTIRAVFEYSWDLLTAQEKQVFSGLSLFKGGFTREAAMSVTGMTLPILTMLIDKSMVRRQSSGRYEIHPLLSQYAAEKLSFEPGRLIQIQTQYTDFYCEWISRMDIKLKGHSQVEALNLLRYDSKNLVAVWQWLVEHHDYGHLRQVIPAYLAYYEYHNRFTELGEVSRLLRELIQWLKPEYDNNDEDWIKTPHADLLSLSIAALRHFSLPISGAQAILQLQRKSLLIAQTLPDSSIKALSLLINATGQADIGVEKAILLCQESIDIFKRLDDSWGIALATLVMGDNAFFNLHNLKTAWDCYQSSLTIFKELGNEWGQGKCLYGMSSVKRQECQLKDAYDLGSQSVWFFERLNSQASYYLGQIDLAEIAESLGQIADARQRCELLLAFFKQIEDEKSQKIYLDKISELDNFEIQKRSPVA